MAEPIGEWTTDKLLRYITHNIPPASFPVAKNIKLDSIDVDTLTVRGKFFHSMEAPQIIQPAGAGQPNFQNSWANFGGGYGVARFWKDPWGIVHITGVLLNPAVNPGSGNQTVVTTLPVGYRPPSTVQLPQRATSGGVDYAGYVQIPSTGAITAGIGQLGIGVGVAIANITFEGSFRTT